MQAGGSQSTTSTAGSSDFEFPASLEELEEETVRREVTEEIKVSSQNVAQLVKDHSEDINEAYNEYLEAKKDEPLQKLLLEKERHDREVANLNKQIAMVSDEIEETKTEESTT
jgi:hypothetical protein